MKTENDKPSHDLSVLVANKPGVLARVAQVFARLGYNIDSLVVSPAADGHYSRMTITASGDPEELHRILKQMNKLVDVVHCYDHTGENTVVRELALVKVRVGTDNRTGVLQIAEHFGCKTVDLTASSMIIMATGTSSKLDALMDMVRDYEIVEICRTGKVVMARGDQPT